MFRQASAEGVYYVLKVAAPRRSATSQVGRRAMPTQDASPYCAAVIGSRDVAERASRRDRPSVPLRLIRLQATAILALLVAACDLRSNQKSPAEAVNLNVAATDAVVGPTRCALDRGSCGRALGYADPATSHRVAVRIGPPVPQSARPASRAAWKPSRPDPERTPSGTLRTRRR